VYRIKSKFYPTLPFRLSCLFLLCFGFNIFFSEEECGLFSVRGITAFLVFWAPLIAFLISILFVCCCCKNILTEDEGDEKKKEIVDYQEIENMSERPNKTMKLRTDFYSVTFMGYVYIDKEQRKEIILDEE
jgi:predicted membrane protein